MVRKIPFYVIPRYDARNKEVILFLPDTGANLGNIAYYVHMGQHGEADTGYYRSTKRVPPEAKARHDLHELLREYRQKLDPSEFLKIVTRDTPRCQKIRWSIGISVTFPEELRA